MGLVQPVTATITDTFVAASKLYIFNVQFNGATAGELSLGLWRRQPLHHLSHQRRQSWYTCSSTRDTVRGQITDTFGNISLGSLNVDASTDCAAPTDLNTTPEPAGSNDVFLPLITDYR